MVKSWSVDIANSKKRKTAKMLYIWFLITIVGSIITFQLGASIFDALFIVFVFCIFFVLDYRSYEIYNIELFDDRIEFNMINRFKEAKTEVINISNLKKIVCTNQKNNKSGDTTILLKILKKDNKAVTINENTSAWNKDLLLDIYANVNSVIK